MRKTVNDITLAAVHTHTHTHTHVLVEVNKKKIDIKTCMLYSLFYVQEIDI